MEAPLRGPWTLPNFITLLRLAALPFFLVSISDGRFDIALAIFVVAGISDGVDGYLARHFDMKSALGAYLDPIADKLLLISSYLFLAIPSYPARAKVPVWLAVMVLSRDFLLLLVALLMILTGRKRSVPAELGGQGHDGHADRDGPLRPVRERVELADAHPLIAFGATATTTVISGFGYVYSVARESAPAATSP